MRADVTGSVPYIKDVATAGFEREVLQRSTERPVVVDFWATWCAPCRVLGPVLEAEIKALDGKVELAKVDTDRSPDLAGAFGIQGIPAVKAFRDGKVVAEFVGARPAPFIRTWLAGLVPSESAQVLAGAEQAVREGRLDAAEAALRPLLDDPESRDRAALLLARALVAAGRAQEVPPVLGRIDPRSDAADAVPAIERLLTFAQDAASYGGEEKARAAVASNERDLEARWALGAALAARGAMGEALEQFLEIVSRNRKFRDDGARLAMLAIFDQLGSDNPLTGEYRRWLQIVL